MGLNVRKWVVVVEKQGFFGCPHMYNVSDDVIQAEED